MAWLKLLRPHQWVKNLFVFAGLVFGKKLLHLDSVLLTLAGFVCLCLASSTVYILNDIHDRAEDRLHPRKSKRPIAAGQIGVAPAAVLAGVLLMLSVASAFLMRPSFGVLVVTYLLLQVGYTLALKHAVILDVVAIGLGFVLRAISGAVLVDVDISHWLELCTFTLCLFMGFSKRRCELNAMAERTAGQPAAAARHHRRTLAVYTPELLNHMTTVTAGIAIVSFMLYATDERTIRFFGTETPYLLYTLPIVVYAIFRFAVLVEHGQVDGPTDVLLRDRPFQAAVLCWGLAALLIVYQGPWLKGWLGG